MTVAAAAHIDQASPAHESQIAVSSRQQEHVQPIEKRKAFQFRGPEFRERRKKTMPFQCFYFRLHLLQSAHVTTDAGGDC